MNGVSNESLDLLVIYFVPTMVQQWNLRGKKRGSLKIMNIVFLNGWGYKNSMS